MASSYRKIRDFALLAGMALHEKDNLDHIGTAPVALGKKQRPDAWFHIRRIASFLFTGKPWQKAEKPQPVDEQAVLQGLRPRQAFELGLGRVKEFQLQAALPVMAIAGAMDLTVAGYYLQNGHMNDMGAGVAMPLLAFNVCAGYVSTRLMSRFEMLKLIRISYDRLGEDRLSHEVTRMRAAIREYDTFGLQHRISHKLSRFNRKPPEQ